MIVESKRGSEDVLVEPGQVDDETGGSVVGARDCEQTGEKARLRRNWSVHTLADPIEDGVPKSRLVLCGRGETKRRRIRDP